MQIGQRTKQIEKLTYELRQLRMPSARIEVLSATSIMIKAVPGDSSLGAIKLETLNDIEGVYYVLQELLGLDNKGSTNAAEPPVQG